MKRAHTGTSFNEKITIFAVPVTRKIIKLRFYSEPNQNVLHENLFQNPFAWKIILKYTNFSNFYFKKMFRNFYIKNEILYLKSFENNIY